MVLFFVQGSSSCLQITFYPCMQKSLNGCLLVLRESFKFYRAPGRLVHVVNPFVFTEDDPPSFPEPQASFTLHQPSEHELEDLELEDLFDPVDDLPAEGYFDSAWDDFVRAQTPDGWLQATPLQTTIVSHVRPRSQTSVTRPIRVTLPLCTFYPSIWDQHRFNHLSSCRIFKTASHKVKVTA